MKIQKILALLSCIFMVNATAQAADAAGTIMEQKGDVRVEGKPVSGKTNVYEGNTISTGNNGEALVRATDGTTVAVRPNSSIKLDKYRFSNNQAKPANENFFIRLAKGGFRAVTGAIGKRKPSNFKVNTTTATIGIRGTDFEVSVVEQDRQGAYAGTYSRVIKGGTYIQNQHGKIVDIGAGQAGFSPRDMNRMASDFGIMDHIPDVFFDGSFDDMLNEMHDDAMQDMDKEIRNAAPKGTDGINTNLDDMLDDI